MAISLTCAQRHIDNWKRQIPGLKSGWSRFLYHTANVQVIPSILRAGVLIPRSSQHTLIYDVAAWEPINRNPDAHDYCRFYFRPRTLFHVITEGIRCLSDAWRPTTQMPVPIILAFDALSLLTLPGVSYTKGKFADPDVPRGHDEAFFNSIDFAEVYQDTATKDRDVRHKRMAELIFAGELPLENHLKYIICRTPYDRITLLSFLTAEEKKKYADIIKIEKTSGIYFVTNYALYIRDIKFYNGQIILGLKHPRGAGATGYNCKVKQIRNGVLIVERIFTLQKLYTPQIITGFENIPDCTWEIELDNFLAFAGNIPSDSSSLV